MFNVSINVHATGTTDEINCWILVREVSIHVPARGTTRRRKTLAVLYGVSIHVPARGTTRTDKGDRVSLPGFNPRSREGNDGMVGC